jgi:hypothetical protein
MTENSVPICFVSFVFVSANRLSLFTGEITKYISQADGLVVVRVGALSSEGSAEEALTEWK